MHRFNRQVLQLAGFPVIPLRCNQEMDTEVPEWARLRLNKRNAESECLKDQFIDQEIVKSEIKPTLHLKINMCKIY